jgi:hypothetical protein
VSDRARSARRLAGGTLRGRARRRWAVAGAVAGLWLVFLYMSGSAVGSLGLLLVLAVFLVVCAVALRSLGVGRDHPMVRSLSTRPWRDGREVLTLALRHLPEAFIITPTGSLLAPSAIDLCMHPADVESLASVIDLGLVNASAAEAYAAEIAACSARVRPGVPIEVAVVADPAVPEGRYALRQRRYRDMAVGGAAPSPAAAPAVSGPAFAGPPAQFPGPPTQGERPPTRAMTAGSMLTDAAPALPLPLLAPNPMLRLMTGDTVTQTRVSGARAGRGRGVELMLPDEPTLSRVHAQFTCTGGQWAITALGRNGVRVNTAAITDGQVIRDGDVIQWGQNDDSPRSWVEIVP